MQDGAAAFDRTTTADRVFDRLYGEIVSLKLPPGAKLSEAEVAKRFGVSRQPVHDAFARLRRLELLWVRPQKATEVRGFSLAAIEHARFVRLAVELEVVRRACAVWDARRQAALELELAEQEQAVEAGRTDWFHELDFRFHRMVCELSGLPLAFATIREYKRKIDRICVLSLGQDNEIARLHEDHRALSRALVDSDAEQAVTLTRRHLGRLDATIAQIHAEYSEYFEEPPA